MSELVAPEGTPVGIRTGGNATQLPLKANLLLDAKGRPDRLVLSDPAKGFSITIPATFFPLAVTGDQVIVTLGLVCTKIEGLAPGPMAPTLKN